MRDRDTGSLSERLQGGPVTLEQREMWRMRQAVSELARVAPETAAIVEGWAKLWRPSDDWSGK